MGLALSRERLVVAERNAKKTSREKKSYNLLKNSHSKKLKPRESLEGNISPWMYRAIRLLEVHREWRVLLRVSGRRVVQAIMSTFLQLFSLILLGDLTTIGRLLKLVGDALERTTKMGNQDRYYDSSMLLKEGIPLSRESDALGWNMVMEVEDENETAITLIQLFICGTTEDGGNS
ncbi:hypothetical protein Tco_0894937 [Tanacetum coccineum]|uniref:Uncharacterized protein n=1 Tax=Tanacetum coccineum TaxID=301880 RepID=A0ABQ5CD52_9ASTR